MTHKAVCELFGYRNGVHRTYCPAGAALYTLLLIDFIMIRSRVDAVFWTVLLTSAARDAFVCNLIAFHSDNLLVVCLQGDNYALSIRDC